MVPRSSSWHRLLVLAGVTSLAGGLSGCAYRTTALGAADAGAAPREGAVTLHFFVFGLIGGGDVDVRDHCRGRAVELRLYSDVATLAASVLTLGVYTPRRVALRCAEATP